MNKDVLFLFVIVVVLASTLVYICVLKNKEDCETKKKENKTVNYKDLIGKGVWLYLHAIAETYPSNATSDQKRRFKRHVEDFAIHYPCASCREHMRMYFTEHPLLVDNRAQAVYWMYEFHNAVNDRLGKKMLDKSGYINRLSNYDPPINPVSLHLDGCPSCKSL